MTTMYLLNLGSVSCLNGTEESTFRGSLSVSFEIASEWRNNQRLNQSVQLLILL